MERSDAALEYDLDRFYELTGLSDFHVVAGGLLDLVCTALAQQRHQEAAFVALRVLLNAHPLVHATRPATVKAASECNEAASAVVRFGLKVPATLHVEVLARAAG